MKKYLFLALCVIIGLSIYIISPIGTHKDYLTSAQVDHLCDCFAEQVSSKQFSDIENTCQAAVDIFGTKGKGEYTTVFGYVSAGEYLKHKDKAYDVSGFNEVFMVKIALDGNEVKIVKQYGDGVSTKSTLKEMPLKYRLMAKRYNAFDENGYCKVAKEADKKAEEALGVPVETGCSLSISGKEYEIFNIDTDGNIICFEKGKRKDF